MKIMKAIISSILVLAMSFTFIACDEEDNETAAAETTTAAATTSETEEDSAVTADTAENSAEDTAAENITEDTTAEDTVDSTSVITTKPAEDTTKAPTTTAPAEDTTKAPTTAAPAEDTTKAPTTTAPTEDTTKAQTTTAPAESSAPNTDGGENYPLNMLPEPLPFTDKTEWICIHSTDDVYIIATKEYIWNTNDEYQTCLKIMEEYANSFTKYGYIVRTRNNNTQFVIFDEFGHLFFTLRSGAIFSIEITVS